MSFQSLYVGSTGLISCGTRMQTLGNNIANVNTVGYKNANLHFESLFSRSVTTGEPTSVGMSQRGLGVRVGAILTDFGTGAVMDGNATTDLAISGKGFFRVVDPKDSGSVHYTRAGNFRFDKNGFLVDPTGYRLQGKAITDGTAGATGDIRLAPDDVGRMSIPAEATSLITFLPNIGSSDDKAVDADDPFFSMLSSWDGTRTPPLGGNQSAFSSSITVYDENGTAHVVTFHFDGVTLSNAGNRSYYEFMVTMDPAEDGGAAAGTSGAGLLMAGVLAFDSTGALQDVSAFSYSGTGDVKALSNWSPTGLSADGYPQFTATFAGTGSGAGAVSTIGMNFGLSASSWASGKASNAAAVGTSASALPSMSSPTHAALAATNHTGSSAILFQSQDGSPDGVLMNLSVDESGVLIGNYSNGVHKDLYQITLYNFPGEYGLRREGSNHFSESLASGQAVEGVPGEDNFGTISEDSLEASNVDMADQFVRMIMNERAFQANSKVVTTSDQILQMLYGMKR